MKVSAIIPSIYPPLCTRIVSQLILAPRPVGVEIELIVVSKDPPMQHPNVVWVRELIPQGNNPPNRIAFGISTGDWILNLCDELLVNIGVWNIVANNLPNPETPTIAAMDGGGWGCFDKRYACLPLSHRSTVLKHFQYYYPYRAHWGDPAYSMSIWRSGGSVFIPSEVPFTWGDRMGQPESQHKRNSFDSDMQLFLADFPEMAAGWDTSDWTKFNRVFK